MTDIIDPTLFYCLVIADDDPTKTSPFQGFSHGLIALNWAMHRLPQLPVDLLEPALPHQAVLARRIGGVGGWRWCPLALRALKEIEISTEAPFWVVFSGTKTVAAAVSKWASHQIVPPLHVTPDTWEGAEKAEDLNADVVRAHAQTTLRRVIEIDSTLDAGSIPEALNKWQPRPKVQANFPKRAHNCTLPNHMTLESAGIEFGETAPLISQTERDYIDAIRETSRAVLDLRESAGWVPGFRVTPPQPGIILTSPSLYRHAYRGMRQPSKDWGPDPRAVRTIIRMFQKQSGFKWDIDRAQFERLHASKEVQEIVRVRQEELEIHTLAVGLRGASTLAATLRLPPAVNLAASAVRALADHARGQGTRRRAKFVTLFSKVQRRLLDAVGEELVEEIMGFEGAVKLVTDAPLEWLPIGDLPLGIRYDVSRITSTPGNLMVGELIQPDLLRLKLEAFREVLIVSAFEADDRIRRMIPDALDTLDHMWPGKLSIRAVEAQNLSDFKQALKAYHGAILIFDGHGYHDQGSDIGTLRIGSEDVDVWSLRGEVRVPPIVILSACDTHALARSHATTANGFLTLGARAVLGTLLPVSAPSAAVFIGRLLYRLADFLPAALKTYKRAIVWSEVIGGMLRMQLLTDLLRPLAVLGHLTEEKRRQIHTLGNVEINSGKSAWYEEVINLVAVETSLEPDAIRNVFRKAISLSETIRYVHMGNPESILIDDPVLSGTVEVGVQERPGEEVLEP